MRRVLLGGIHRGRLLPERHGAGASSVLEQVLHGLTLLRPQLVEGSLEDPVQATLGVEGGSRHDAEVHVRVHDSAVACRYHVDADVALG